MRKLLLFICVATTMLSCTKSEEVGVNTSSSGDAVSFIATEILTRVTDDGSEFNWEVNDEIAINTTCGDDSYYSIYKIDDTSSGVMGYLSGDTVKLDDSNSYKAWYPASLGSEDGILSLDLTTQDNIKQLLVAETSTYSSESKSIGLTFSPKYVKVQLTFSVDTTDYSMWSVPISISGANTQGLYDIKTNQYSELKSTTIHRYESELVNTPVTFYFLESENMDGEITVTLGNTLAISLVDKSWKSGYTYTYNISSGGDQYDIIYKDDVYNILTANGLIAFENLVNGNNNTTRASISGDNIASFGTQNSSINGRLCANIDLEGDVNNQWTSIGGADNAYSGTFDGASYSIYGLYIDNDVDYQGLFGYINRGTVKNLSVYGAVKSTGNNIGGIVGYSAGVVEGCHNYVEVTGSDCVGGVIGYLFTQSTISMGGSFTSSFSSSSNRGKVTGSGSSVGGVVGYATGTIAMHSCYNSGDVTSADCAGGVVGQALLTVSNCYNKGNVTAITAAGGIVGYVKQSTDDTLLGITSSNTIITNCYNLGELDSSSIGQVIGCTIGTETSIQLSNCYWQDEYVNSGDFIGVVIYFAIGSNGTGLIENCTSKTDSYMKTQDFVTLLGSSWKIDNGSNNGYPILSWQ